MKNILYILTLLISTTASAQFYVDGAIVHNNGAVLQVNANTVNNSGTINNLGNTHFNGNYIHTGITSIISNQAVTDTIFCNGNWDITDGNYDGTNDFGNGYQGTLVFNGSNQIFTDNYDFQASSVYNVVFTGGGVKNVNGSLTVYNNLHLGGGIVRTTTADTFAVISDGTITGAFGSLAHVNGPFYREANSAISDLLFPIGDGVRYRPATLKSLPPGATRPVFGFEVVNGATGGTAGLGVDNIIDTRHWRGELLEGDYQGAQIELSYGAVEGVTDQSQLVVTQANVVGGSYESLDQSGTTGGLAAGTVISEFEAGNEFFMIGQSANLRADLNVFLEGAYNTGTGAMTDSLFAGSYGSILTDNYGYASAGANPYGIKMMNRYNVGPSLGVDPVDVIMLTIRDVAAPSVDIDTTYAWLMSDGTIRDFSTGGKQYATFSKLSLNTSTNYAIVVWHRNHVPIMFESTGQALTQSTVTPVGFDFTTPTNVYGIGYKDLLNNGTISGMYIGNAEQNWSPLEVNALDLWVVANDAQNNMPAGDLINTDVNLDGKTNQTDWDKTKWANDQLYFSTIP